MEGLFNPLTILLHVVNAGILGTALYFLLLRPVRRFMNDRKARVEAELSRVDIAGKSLEEHRNLVEDELAVAKIRAADSVAQSVADAREQAQKVMQKANADAENILKQAQMEAESMRRSAREEMRGEVAELSVMLAGKLLQREVSDKDHEKLIEEFLEKVV